MTEGGVSPNTGVRLSALVSDATPDEFVVCVNHSHKDQGVEALVIEELAPTIARLLALEVLTISTANAMWQIPAQGKLVGDLQPLSFCLRQLKTNSKRL